MIRQVDVGVEPEGMAISPDNRIAVTTSETTNMAHLIDTATFDVIDNILVDPRPRHAEFTRDGKQLWVTSEIGGTVTIIDMATRKAVKTLNFTIPGIRGDLVQPVGMTLTRDNTRAFIALGPANRIAVIDTATLEVIKYVLVGQRVWHMALTPEEDMLLTTNGVSNDVTVIDVRRLQPVKSIAVGRYPWGIAIKPSS